MKPGPATVISRIASDGGNTRISCSANSLGARRAGFASSMARLQAKSPWLESRVRVTEMAGSSSSGTTPSDLSVARAIASCFSINAFKGFTVNSGRESLAGQQSVIGRQSQQQTRLGRHAQSLQWRVTRKASNPPRTLTQNRSTGSTSIDQRALRTSGRFPICPVSSCKQ